MIEFCRTDAVFLRAYFVLKVVHCGNGNGRHFVFIFDNIFQKGLQFYLGEDLGAFTNHLTVRGGHDID